MTKRRNSSRNSKPRKYVSKSRNASQLREAFSWLVGNSLNNLQKHGNTKWEPTSLAILALLWSISGETTLTKAFRNAKEQVLSLFGNSAVSTYQGLLKALVVHGLQMRRFIMRRLQSEIQILMGSRFAVDGWVPLAIDGSNSRNPRSKSNERAFIPANYGNGEGSKYRKLPSKNKPSTVTAPAPKILITMIWQMTARLPWAWKLGRTGTGERTLALEMLQEERFPQTALFVADAGFYGYTLWQTIMDRGFGFLFRVGSNVKFLTDEKNHVMVRRNRVYYWPDKHSRKKEQPLVLRLIRVTLGSSKVVLVTNVLEQNRLADSLAIKFYKLRWGIELEFRALKQIFQRSKLKCKNADRCEQELDWSILALTVIDCYSMKIALEQSPVAITPQTSFAHNLDAFRDSLSHLNNNQHPRTLFKQLALSKPDSYQRDSTKLGRYRPKGKDRPPTGLPIIAKITREQRLILIEIQLAIAA